MSHIWVVMAEYEDWSYIEDVGSIANYYDEPVHAFSSEEAAKDFQTADKKLYKKIVQIPFD